jgi:hypothetical protein
MRRILSVGCIVLLAGSFTLSGQVSPGWTSRYAGPTNSQDAPRSLVVDDAGNAYLAGVRTTDNLPDVVALKYGPSGEQVWVHTFGAGGTVEHPSDLEVDLLGNVYVYGSTGTLYSSDLALFKINSAGALHWMRTFDAALTDYPAQMTIDGSGNAYLTGVAVGSGPPSRFLTLKYDAAGNLVWSRAYQGSNGGILTGDFAGAVVVNSSGEVYATGVSVGQSGSSTFVLKYDNGGTLLWSASYPSSTYAQRIALDSSENVYIGATGRDSELLALKFNSAGTLLWSGTYRGMSQFTDALSDMAVDSVGNVYVTGQSSGTASHDIVTVKFNANGSRQWVSRYNNHLGNSSEVARGVEVDRAGAVYVGGYTYGGDTQHDFLALKYDADGNQKWVFIHDQAGGPDFVSSFGLSAAGVFLAGSAEFPETGYDMLTLKLEQQSISGLPQILSSPQDVELIAGLGDAVFSVLVESATPITYQWRYNGADIPGATGQSYTISAPDAGDAGEYSVRVSNAVGVTATPEALLTVHRPPTATIFTTSLSIVEGATLFIQSSVNGDAPLRFQWRLNNVDLVGQTNEHLRLVGVSTNNTGSYTLVVRNPWGDSVSNPLQVNVSPRGPVDRWTWRSPLPQGNELTDIAFGNGRYVAVGDDGTVVVSTNARDWSVHTADYGDFISIAFGDGLFAALAQGLLYTSSDGVTWTNRALPANRVVFGAGRFVAAGGPLLSSDDGVSWVEHGTNWLGGTRALTFGNGIFLINSYNGALTSSNGIDWVHHAEARVVFPSIAAGNGVFVAHNYSQLVVSTNGLDWESVLIFNDGNYFDEVRFANGQFYALGTKLLTSADGRSWAERMSQPEGGMRLTSAVGSAGQTIVVGDEGLIFVSSDGAMFTQVGGGTRNNLRAIVYANNRFTMVGNDGVIWNSTDGATFMDVTSPTTNNLRAIAFGNDTYVVVGDAGTILTSCDAIFWQPVDLVTNDLYGIAFANGHFTVVGELGRVLVTTNLHDWTVTFAGTGRRLQGIAYGGGHYVATGQQGNYAVSTNAVHWQAARNDSMGYMESIVYTNGIFVAVGSNGRIFTSPDGAQWTHRMTGNGQELESIIYVRGQFIAAGDNGTIMTSTNAVDWVAHRFLTRNSFRQIIYARGALWGVGNNEMVVKSGQLQPYVTLGSGPLSGRLVQVLAEPGQIVELHASSNLTNWQTLSSGPASAEGAFSHIDPTVLPQRFYRAVAP